jgi:hypothetical protein
MIDTGAGVIDADYRGTVHVLLFNLSDKDYEGELEEVDEAARQLTRLCVSFPSSRRGRSRRPADSRENCHAGCD